jgi:cytochrome c-type biogenesis protein CcmH
VTTFLLLMLTAFGAGQKDYVPVDAETIARAEIPGVPPGPPPPADQVDDIAHEISDKLRCPVCQGLSVADSNASTAVNMANHVRALVAKGYTEDDIREFFISTYGEWIVLDPEPEGLDTLIWLGPGLVVGLGIAWALTTVVGWRKEPEVGSAPAADEPLDPFEQQLLAQLNAEIEADEPAGGR